MPIVRLPGGELRDEIRQPLYDTLTVQTDPSLLNNQRWFSDIQGKAVWQTNLRQPNLLETAVSFRVQGMHVDAQYINTGAAALPACLPSIMEYSSVRVRIGEKDYWNGPMAYLMGRVEQNAAINAGGAGAANVVYQRAGAQAVQGVILAGRHVVDINPLQSFFAELSVAIPSFLAAATTLSGNDRIYLKFSFKGLLRRPVQ